MIAKALYVRKNSEKDSYYLGILFDVTDDHHNNGKDREYLPYGKLNTQFASDKLNKYDRVTNKVIIDKLVESYNDKIREYYKDIPEGEIDKLIKERIIFYQPNDDKEEE